MMMPNGFKLVGHGDDEDSDHREDGESIEYSMEDDYNSDGMYVDNTTYQHELELTYDLQDKINTKNSDKEIKK